jgi:hypothetical protein
MQKLNFRNNEFQPNKKGEPESSPKNNYNCFPIKNGKYLFLF